jgi:hypothetical protein
MNSNSFLTVKSPTDYPKDLSACVLPNHRHRQPPIFPGIARSTLHYRSDTDIMKVIHAPCVASQVAIETPTILDEDS